MIKAIEIIISIILVVLPLAASADANDLKVTRSPVGTPVEVTAGQEFYAETQLEEVPAYRLEKPFKSSMGGAMGFPFSFAIETDLLLRTKVTASGWEVFIPEGGKFRASHGLLGSVLAEGDTVGLRVHPSGEQEWFVDNSNKNGHETIWSRKVKEKDPKLTRLSTKMVTPSGGAVERLIYLGLDGEGNARIRHEQIFKSDIVRDEFTFPLDEDGFGMGAVRGSEFTIRASAIRATITVIEPMTSELGNPVE